MSLSDDAGRPLYARVRDQLLTRIRAGEWQAGQIIPTEFEIAAEYNVSQGTARKAVNELAALRVVVRQQGRGTFVMEHTPDQVSSRFFNFFTDDGERIELGTLPSTCSRASANGAEREALKLAKDAEVLRIYRVRTRDKEPIISEAISLPARLFEGLTRDEISNALYDVFQKRFGILVVRIADRLSTVAADKRRARELIVPEGTPLLRIDRVTFAPDDQPVEWRVSLCHLKKAHYATQTS